MTVERPLRLHSQLSLQAVETLRFASGDEDLRAALYEEFGDTLFTRFESVVVALEKRLPGWGADEGDDSGDDEDSAKKGLPERKHKQLLDPSTWKRDGRLVEMAATLRAALGDRLFEDHNVFRDRVDEALKAAGTKLPAAELKLVLKAASWRVETAPPVIARTHKPGKATADPLLGLYEAYPCRQTLHRRVQTWATPTCATPSKCPCWKKAASRLLSAARCGPTRRTPGSTTTPPALATKSASRATSNKLGQCKRVEEREFYLRMALQQRWGKRELERQFRLGAFERAVADPPQESSWDSRLCRPQ